MQRVLHYVAYATFMLHRMTCYIVRHMVHYMAKGKQIADGTEVASQLTSRWGYYPDYPVGSMSSQASLNCPSFGGESTSDRLLCPFDIPPSFWGHFLAFWYHQMFQAHLARLLTLPFLQGAPVPSVKEWRLEA